MLTVGIFILCVVSTAQTFTIAYLVRENTRLREVAKVIMKASIHQHNQLQKDNALLHARLSRKDKYDNG